MYIDFEIDVIQTDKIRVYISINDISSVYLVIRNKVLSSFKFKLL